MDNLEIACKNRFKHLNNDALIARINNAPDFGWDDEGVEINRRAKEQNFELKMIGDTLKIIQ